MKANLQHAQSMQLQKPSVFSGSLLNKQCPPFIKIKVK